MIKVEIPVEKLIDCHHNEMNERVKSQSSEAVKFYCAFFALILRQFNNKYYAYFCGRLRPIPFSLKTGGFGSVKHLDMPSCFDNITDTNE